MMCLDSSAAGMNSVRHNKAIVPGPPDQRAPRRLPDFACRQINHGLIKKIKLSIHVSLTQFADQVEAMLEPFLHTAVKDFVAASTQ